MRELAAAVGRQVSIPYTIGGGIAGFDDIRHLLQAGAEKVSINSAAIGDKQLIRRVSEAFGNQAIVVAIDAKRSGDRWEVFTAAGTKATGLDVIEWAAEAQRLGAGEILLTSMDADGHKAGFDCELNASVVDAVNIPVIASGGAGGPEDICGVLTDGKADAALAASIFHYGQYTIGEVKQYLADRGVPVRL